MNKGITNISRQSKVVVLGGDLNSAKTFTYDLKSLGFKPDYFIVRSTNAVATNSADEQPIQIYCNLIADIIDTIIIVNGSSPSNPLTIVDLREKSLNTNLLSISVQTLEGAVPTISHTIYFSIGLEFHKD